MPRRGGDGLEQLRNPFLRRDAAERPDQAGVCRDPKKAAHLLTVVEGRLRIGDPHLDMANRCVGLIAGEVAGQVRVVDDRQLRRADREGDERPVAKELSAETGGKQVAEMGLGVRVIGREFREIVVEARLDALEQPQCPGLVHLRVMQHEQAGVAKQIRPHEIVRGGVPQLVDDEIVGLAPVAPDEVMTARRDRGRSPQPRRQQRDQLGRVGGDAGSIRRHGAEPGNPHDLHCAAAGLGPRARCAT